MKSKKRRDMIFYCFMIAIPVIQFCIMFIGVNINSVLLAFKEYDLNMNYTWTMGNFKEVIKNFLRDEYLQTSLKNSVFFYFITTIITLPTSLVISFYFYKKFPFSRSLKIILFLPSVIASVVAVTVVYYIADRGWPILVEFFTGKTDAMGLLVNSDTRLITLLGWNTFYSLSSGFLFYSSAMSGIDESVSEAARIDGANMMQEFCHITLPMIFPTFYTFLVSGVAGALIGDYGMYAFSKTAGGSAVPTMGYYITSGIMADTSQVRYPYYAALGIVLSVMTSVIVFSTRGFLNRFDPYEEKELKRERKKMEGKVV